MGEGQEARAVVASRDELESVGIRARDEDVRDLSVLESTMDDLGKISVDLGSTLDELIRRLEPVRAEVGVSATLRDLEAKRSMRGSHVEHLRGLVDRLTDYRERIDGVLEQLDV